MSWFNKAALVSCVLSISACGFTPVHGQKNIKDQASLASVDIHVARSREEAWLKIALEDRFNPTNIPASKDYILEPSLQIHTLPVIVESTGKIQRYRIKINAPYVLKNAKTNEVIKTGTFNRLVSYNVSNSDYSTFIAPTDAIKRGIDELAADYEAYFSAYFFDKH